MLESELCLQSVDQNLALKRLELLRTSLGNELFEECLNICAAEQVHIRGFSFTDVNAPVPGTHLGPYTWFEATVDQKLETSGFVWVFPFVLNCPLPHSWSRYCSVCASALLMVLLKQAGLAPAEYAAKIRIKLADVPPPENLPIPTAFTAELSFDDEALDNDPVRCYLDTLDRDQLCALIAQARESIEEFEAFCQRRSAIAMGSDKEIENVLKPQFSELFSAYRRGKTQDFDQKLSEFLDSCESLLDIKRPKAVHRQLRQVVEKLITVNTDNTVLVERATALYATACIQANLRPTSWILKMLTTGKVKGGFSVKPFLPVLNDAAVAQFIQAAVDALTDSNLDDRAVKTLWDEVMVLALAWDDAEYVAEIMLDHNLKQRALTLLDQAGSAALANQTFLQVTTEITNRSDLTLPPEEVFSRFVDMKLPEHAKTYFSTAFSLTSDIRYLVFLQAAYALTGEELDLDHMEFGNRSLDLRLWRAVKNGNDNEARTVANWFLDHIGWCFDHEKEPLLAYLTMAVPDAAIKLYGELAALEAEQLGKPAYRRAADYTLAAINVACSHKGDQRKQLLDQTYEQIKELLLAYKNRPSLRREFQQRVPNRSQLEL